MSVEQAWLKYVHVLTYDKSFFTAIEQEKQAS